MSSVGTNLQPVQNNSLSTDDGNNFQASPFSDASALDPQTLYQPKNIEDEEIVFNFEDVDLSSVASYMEKVHGVTFITDDVVTATSSTSTGSTLQGHKVSFRMFKTLKPEDKAGICLFHF